MKKLTALVSLLLCITIGGVYATWIFAGDTIMSQTDPFVNKMGDVDTSTSAGSYHFVNNTINLVVEPENADSYKADITWSGDVTLQFAANDTISTGPLSKALNATIVIEAVDIANATYEGTQIYTLNDTFEIKLTDTSWAHDSATNTYSYKITADALADAVSIGNFVLDNYDEYRAFKLAQDVVKFKFRVNPAS